MPPLGWRDTEAKREPLSRVGKRLLPASPLNDSETAAAQWPTTSTSRAFSSSVIVNCVHKLGQPLTSNAALLRQVHEFDFCARVVSRYRGQLLIYSVTFGLRRCDCSMHQSVMIYGTGGGAWVQNSVTLTADCRVAGCGARFLPGQFASATFDNNRTGWVAGAGLEWMITPNWLIRGEWLHVDVGNSSGVLNIPTGIVGR